MQNDFFIHSAFSNGEVDKQLRGSQQQLDKIKIEITVMVDLYLIDYHLGWYRRFRSLCSLDPYKKLTLSSSRWLSSSLPFRCSGRYQSHRPQDHIAFCKQGGLGSMSCGNADTK